MIGRRTAGLWLLSGLAAGLAPAVRFPVSAATVVAAPDSLLRALKRARPGDRIALASGLYEDWQIKIPTQVRGAAGARIVIGPAEAGGVVFTGRSGFDIYAAHLQLEDLTFRGSHEQAVTLRGDGNRLTGLRFLASGARESSYPGLVEIHPGAERNEIDHCSFTDNLSTGIKLRVPIAPGGRLPLGNHIHHNRFLAIRRLRDNGQEPIQLGQSGKAAHHMIGTLVEENLFFQAQGDYELVSVKCSGNVIRNNIALDSYAELVLRIGRRNLVAGNVLLRTRGGIRISGDGHKVVGNVVIAPSKFGLLLTAGSKRYRAATNALIAGNIVRDAPRALVFQAYDKAVSELARGNRIAGNHLQGAIGVAAGGSVPLDAYLRVNQLEPSFGQPGMSP